MKAHRVNDEHVAFHCPGCESAHMIRDSAGGWTFNGNFERPTFTPSVLVTGTQPITDAEHATLMAGGSIETRPLRCHSFVTDGRIQFREPFPGNLARAGRAAIE
jgi:hypothetical protein